MDTEQTIDPREAKRAMLEWVDTHAENILSAFRTMSRDCAEGADKLLADARAIVDTTTPAVIHTVGMLRESADRWTSMVETFERLYEQLPDRDLF